MRDEELKRIVEDAVEILLRNEGEIIKNGIHELTLTHKLAEYLQRNFEDLSVDLSYNRNIELGERKPKYYQDEKYGMPDIVVHKRLANDHNLLVIEIKKQDYKEGRDKDREKLEAFTTSTQAEGYNFQLGLFLDVPVTNEARPIFVWYKNGQCEQGGA